VLYLGKRWLGLPKFMQTLNDHSYKELERLAKQRGITVQERIRAVIIREWVHEQRESDTGR